MTIDEQRLRMEILAQAAADENGTRGYSPPFDKVIERARAYAEFVLGSRVKDDKSMAMIEGWESRPEREAPPERARGQIKQVVTDLLSRHHFGLSTNEILELAGAQGHNLDRGTVSSLLSRLKREGTLERVGKKYRPLT